MEPNAAERARWNDEGWTKAWPKREVLTDTVTPVLIDSLGLQAGERVLDVGCGGGRATMAAWHRVQPGGRVVGADLSGPLLALAAERVTGTTDLTFQQADMQIDRVDRGDFDVVMSQFGVMFFDEPEAAFINIGKHLRAGGRLGFACWQSIEHNPWFLGPALAPFLVPPPPPAPGKSLASPFAFGDPDRVRQILSDAGFSQISIEPGAHQVDVPQSAVVDDAQLRFMGVGVDRMDEARQAVEALMTRFATPDGMRRLPLAYQIVTARISADRPGG
jgi:SAM-dependent methyltransferase